MSVDHGNLQCMHAQNDAIVHLVDAFAYVMHMVRDLVGHSLRVIQQGMSPDCYMHTLS